MQLSFMHSCSFKFSSGPSGDVTISRIHLGICISVITEVSKLFPCSPYPSEDTLSRWGIQQHTGRTDIKHTGITGRIRNYGQHGYPETLGEEEAVICARKSCGVDFFFQADIQKVQIQAQAEGGEGSGLAQGLGSTVMENCLTAQTAQGPGPAFISNTARTDSTKIYQLSSTLEDISGKLKLRTLEIPPRLFEVSHIRFDKWKILQHKKAEMHPCAFKIKPNHNTTPNKTLSRPSVNYCPDHGQLLPTKCSQSH